MKQRQATNGTDVFHELASAHEIDPSTVWPLTFMVWRFSGYGDENYTSLYQMATQILKASGQPGTRDMVKRSQAEYPMKSSWKVKTFEVTTMDFACTLRRRLLHESTTWIETFATITHSHKHV